MKCRRWRLLRTGYRAEAEQLGSVKTRSVRVAGRMGGAEKADMFTGGDALEALIWRKLTAEDQSSGSEVTVRVNERWSSEDERGLTASGHAEEVDEK